MDDRDKPYSEADQNRDFRACQRLDEEWLQFKDQISHMASTANTGATPGPSLGMDVTKLFEPFFKCVKDWETTGHVDFGNCRYFSSDGTGSP